VTPGKTPIHNISQISNRFIALFFLGIDRERPTESFQTVLIISGSFRKYTVIIKIGIWENSSIFDIQSEVPKKYELTLIVDSPRPPWNVKNLAVLNLQILCSRPKNPSLYLRYLLPRRPWMKTRTSAMTKTKGTRDSKIQDDKDVDVLRSPGFAQWMLTVWKRRKLMAETIWPSTLSRKNFRRLCLSSDGESRAGIECDVTLVHFGNWIFHWSCFISFWGLFI